MEKFSGKLFSDLVGEYPEFRLRDRAISKEGLDVYSKSDGIEIPGEVKNLNGRDLLIFYTCAPDKCSASSNVMVVDLRDKSMHVVHFQNGVMSTLLEGAPDVAEFVRNNCRSTTCSPKPAASPQTKPG